MSSSESLSWFHPTLSLPKPGIYSCTGQAASDSFVWDVPVSLGWKNTSVPSPFLRTVSHPLAPASVPSRTFMSVNWSWPLLKPKLYILESTEEGKSLPHLSNPHLLNLHKLILCAFWLNFLRKVGLFSRLHCQHCLDIFIDVTTHSQNDDNLKMIKDIDS